MRADTRGVRAKRRQSLRAPCVAIGLLHRQVMMGILELVGLLRMAGYAPVSSDEGRWCGGECRGSWIARRLEEEPEAGNGNRQSGDGPNDVTDWLARGSWWDRWHESPWIEPKNRNMRKRLILLANQASAKRHLVQRHLVQQHLVQ